MKMPLEEFVYIHEGEEITLRDYLGGDMNIDYEGTARWRIPFGGVDEPDGEIDSDELENRIDRLREEIREKEIHLKSTDTKIKGNDTTVDVQIKSTASNAKQPKLEPEAQAPSPSGNFQILFRALSLLKLAR